MSLGGVAIRLGIPVEEERTRKRRSRANPRLNNLNVPGPTVWSWTGFILDTVITTAQSSSKVKSLESHLHWNSPANTGSKIPF